MGLLMFHYQALENTHSGRKKTFTISTMYLREKPLDQKKLLEANAQRFFFAATR